MVDIGELIVKTAVLFVLVGIIILFLFLLVVPVQLAYIYIEPKVEVLVDQKMIYKGTNACVTVSSGGYTTTVITHKFLCFLPDETYTSKDVVVRTIK